MEHDSGVIQRKYFHQFMEVLLSIHASLFSGSNLVKKFNSFFKAHSEHMIQSSVFKALSSVGTVVLHGTRQWCYIGQPAQGQPAQGQQHPASARI